MANKRILCAFLFIILTLVFPSCHPRHVSDIKPGMTKEEVVSLWGKGLVSYKIVNGRNIETWEYSKSKSICSVDFFKETVVASECHFGTGTWFWQQKRKSVIGGKNIDQGALKKQKKQASGREKIKYLQFNLFLNHRLGYFLFHIASLLKENLI